jgi:hypothetical protein
MTLVSGVVYELDVDWFRLQLKALEESETGMPFDDTHQHNTGTTISGVLFAPQVIIINGYTVTITPPGGWVVSCTGANHNLADVYNNLTGPTLLPNNSAGLVVTQQSGLTTEESAALQFLADIEGGRWLIDETAKQMVFFRSDNVTEVARFNLLDKDGVATGTPAEAFERVRT